MFHYGADYYPEQWPEERWEIDARLMHEAGFNVVRLAEFAWSRMEPQDGRFDFAWLDRVIGILAEQGIKVVLGTPTASPPPWLMAAHPDALIVRADKRRATYGARREYCPTHSVYAEHAARITQAMAEHYRDNPHVIGWQIDNEFGERCYCPNCQRRFHEWLKARCGTLDALNRRWGTVFWSHEYTDWSQIPLPWTTSGIPNPGLALDFYRFMSQMIVAFQQAQIDILRRVCPQHFITHNLMGFGYDQLDYFALAAPLDFVSWDNYPRGFWNDERDVDPARLALGHDTMRSLKNRNFWVMEAQSGPAGWDVIGATPQPGEMRLWAYQAIAHGADGIVFFRWRSARFGGEQFWHGILDHDAQPRRRYREVQRMGAELAALGDSLSGSEVRAEAALMLSYDSRFAFQIQPNNRAFSYTAHFADYYAALHCRNVPAAVVAPDGDLSPYKMVIAPALYVLDADIAANLRGFAQNGGTLAITTRSGVKEESNAVVNLPLPGLLADLCGVTVAEYDSLLEGQTRAVDFVAPGTVNGGKARVWCDVLALDHAQAAACYAENYYQGQPAIAVNAFGKGKVIYVGTVGDSTLVEAVVQWALELAGLRPLLMTPPKVEVTARWQDGRQLLFVLNHAASPQRVTLDGRYVDLITGAEKTGDVLLPARKVLVLKRD